MRETISNGCQVMSDGRRVWVNGKAGESLARLNRFGAWTMIDIHKPLIEQCRDGRECLDCRHDLHGSDAWFYFVEAVAFHFDVTVAVEHRPSWSLPSHRPTPAT